MKKEIEFTIIIPHKNEPFLLQKCLDSIPKENNIEVIVIDDNSSESIVDFTKFPGLNNKNTEVVLLKEAESKGAGHARNIGLEKAKGDWVLFCDADDFFTDVFYQAITNYKESHLDIVIFNIETPQGVQYQGSVYQNLVDLYDEGLPETLEDLKYKIWTPWAKLYRKNFINQANLKFETKRVGNDCFFVLTANDKAKKIKVDKQKIYYHYYNNNGLSHKKKQDYHLFLERLEVTIWRMHFYKKKRLNRYLQGAGIYTYLMDAYKLYNFSVFLKALLLALKLKADFVYPLQFKIRKIYNK
jgi:glycosyltransferase involved in cell wall biosynthesis